MTEAGSVNNNAAWKKSKILLAVERWVSKIETVLNLLGASLIAIIMFFTTYGIIARYVFNSPLYGKVEVTELIMAGVVFFGLAYTQKIGGHVRMSFVIERFIRGRAHHIVESMTTLIALICFSIVTASTLESALYDLEFGGTTPCLYLPVWPSKLTVPFGCFFLCIRLCILFVQHVFQAIAGIENMEL